MTKEEVITHFKNACIIKDISLHSQRKHAVEYQFQRNVWELTYRYVGNFRIHKITNKCCLIWYPYIGPGLISSAGKKEYILTTEEYNELETLYKGDFKQDIVYLETMNKLYTTE